MIDCTCTHQAGVTFDDLRAFTQLLESISDVEMALGMYMAAGASITAGKFDMNQLIIVALMLDPFIHLSHHSGIYS